MRQYVSIFTTKILVSNIGEIQQGSGHSHTVGEECKLVYPQWSAIWQYPLKFKMCHTADPAIPTTRLPKKRTQKVYIQRMFTEALF